MFILRVHCKDQPGVVAAVASSLANADCNIEESAQFNDPLSGCFYMRVVFKPCVDGAEGVFKSGFERIAEQYEMNWEVTPHKVPLKTLIMVSKADHCLNDILYRWRTKHLNIDIVGVVSNHETARELVEGRGLDFHYLPVTPETKVEQEQKLRSLIDDTGAELTVLARYMQILSGELCNDYRGRIINIHHSFLPSFKGAKPYHQAYERGVKVIGATAHFATEDLDEGPIIEQDVKHIDHSLGPRRLQTIGRDIESRVLSRAIELYSERRIFMHGRRTIIL
ncbi:MAG: formyltetrahydrofolate deformylase [Micavibrio sp. TMED27]|nr:formyltetrahydrofolate deformylase [Micavibrio sp.]OUT91477.1 MAG: formyltetrahydrofolate deformylase [Micavibrio sp. TMED27]|tara:strand:- start:528 stop:1367 length:840 start_codon:yes stop_codon:yes gene_type:complete